MEKCNWPCLGIDMSKRVFDVEVDGMTELPRMQFSNSSDGYASLLEWLAQKRIDKVHACVESTSRYHEALAEFLHENGHWVSIVNPRRIKAMRDAEGKQHKTDRLDAGLIARFCRKERPAQWTPQPIEIRQLQELHRRLEDLGKVMQQEINRLESGITCPALRSSVETHVEFLTLQIKQLEGIAKTFVKQHPRLHCEYQLLVSIAGIGPKTALTHLCENGYVDRFQNCRQLEMVNGLVPIKNESGGRRKGEHLSSKSRSRLRKTLYMAALSAMQFNPVIREFAAGLQRRGKPGKVVVCAVMRKLLRIMFGVLKSGTPFDAEHHHRLNRRFA